MSLSRLLAFLLLLNWLTAVGCSSASPSVSTPTPPPTITESPTESNTPPPTSTPTIIASPTRPPTLEPSITPSPPPTATPTPVPTATPTQTPTATPDPYAPLTIDSLANRAWGGGEVVIEEVLERTDTFTRYLITYPGDGLTLYGFMNVPNDGWGFPVALVLHGYIDPDEYETVAYSTRYADALAEAGYFVFHPNYRNYPPSDSGPDPYRIGYAADILNLIAIIEEQSKDITGTLRRADASQIHLMGHSMGGGVAFRVATVRPESVDAVLLYGSMSGDEKRNYTQIRQWTNGRVGDFELAASAETLQKINPIDNLDRADVPFSIHHSNTDQVVPFAWSEELCAYLSEINHPVECFTYNGFPHTFYGIADDLLMQRMIDFFDRH